MMTIKLEFANITFFYFVWCAVSQRLAKVFIKNKQNRIGKKKNNKKSKCKMEQNIKHDIKIKASITEYIYRDIFATIIAINGCFYVSNKKNK